MGQIVIAAYRPRLGREKELLELVRGHVPILRDEGLATDRPAVAMRAQDGTIVEVFEWRSASSADEAHTNPAVRALWESFGALCEFVKLADLPEARQQFPHFEPVELD